MPLRSRPPRGRIRARWPWALALALPLGCAALYTGLGALWLPVFLGTLLALGDAVAFLSARAGLRVLQTISVPECTTGEGVTLTLTLRGRTPLTLCAVQQRLPACTFFDGAVPETDWRPLDAQTCSFSLRAVGVGPQRAGVTALRLFSPLGLFSCTLRLDRPRQEGACPVLVLPRLRPTDEPPFGADDERGAQTRRLLRAGEPDAVSGSRDYLEGESLSRVNWKLTAARRTLYMKDFDAVGMRTDNVLFVAPFPPVLRQAALEAAFAGGALLLRGGPLLLRSAGTRVPLLRGDLTALARALAPLSGAAEPGVTADATLAALADGRACCAVVTDGTEETCRLLSLLPRGSLVLTPGASGWRGTLPARCRAAGVNLCTGRVGEGYPWTRV